MATLNVIFILAICLVGFAFYCCIAAPVLLFAIRERQKIGRWFLGGLTAIVVSYVSLLYGYYSWATRGTAVFEMAFGFAPPADVTIHQSHHFVVGDQGEQSLSFSASQSTIDRILKNRFATSLSQSRLAADGEFHFSRKFSVIR